MLTLSSSSDESSIESESFSALRFSLILFIEDISKMISLSLQLELFVRWLVSSGGKFSFDVDCIVAVPYWRLGSELFAESVSSIVISSSLKNFIEKSH